MYQSRFDGLVQPADMRTISLPMVADDLTLEEQQTWRSLQQHRQLPFGL